MGAVDVAALTVAIIIAGAITAVIALFADTGTRRDWVVGGSLVLLLVAVAIANLSRETPRETHIATAILGPGLAVAGAMGIARATRRMRPWLRWVIVFLFALLLLLGGLLLGAAVLPRFIGG